MARKDIDKRIEKATADTTKLINAMQQLRSEGTASASELAKVAQEAGRLIENYSKLAESVKRSFAQKGDKSQFDKDVKNIESAQKKIGSIQSESQKKYTELTRQEAQKRESIIRELEERSIRNFKKNVERKAQAEKNTRNKIEASNKANTKRVTDFEKRQLDRRAEYYKKKEKEKTEALKKEQREREAQEKRADFGGGFRSQFTGRAIGGALGSLTKYLGLYKILSFAGTAFNKVIVESTKKSIEFEKQLANLGAVAGASSEEIDKLKRAALETAGSTTFTANQIVGLQVALSKLGFSAEQVVTSTRSIAFTAQALGEPLDKVATLIGKTINQFGFLAEETEVVADTLVTTVNKSALSLDSFGTAIQYVGPLASELGFSFEQVSAAMATLADNGFTASRIGTGLRGIFTELGKTSADVRKEIELLAESNLSLSEAVELVGKRNAAQLLTLVRNVAVLDESNNKYYEQGRAIESAAKQIDTVSGQLQLLSSRYDEVQISIGDAILQTEAFSSVIEFLSPKVAQTVAGFKQFRELGTGVFQQNVEEVADGSDAFVTALTQLQNTVGPFQKEFQRIRVEVDEFGNTITNAGMLAGEGAISEDALKRLQGYAELLRDAKKAELERRAALEGRTTIDNIFKDNVDELNDKQKQGIDITAEANAEAKKAEMLLDAYNKTLETRKDLDNETRINIEAMRNQTQLYLNKLSNLLGIQNTLNAANKERYEQQKFDVSLYEEQIENLDDYYEKLKTLYDLEGEQVKSGDALLMINKSKTEIYDELISRIEATKEGITAEMNATDQSTDAGKRKADMHKKELDNLDKLIKKYQEKKEVLTEDLGVMKEIFSQGQKDLQQAQQIDAGESTGFFNRFKRGALQAAGDAKIGAQTEIINRLSTQLLEAAGDDPILKQIAEEYIRNLEVNLGAATDKVDWKEVLTQLNAAFSNAIQDYNETALENKKAYLNQELDQIKDKYKIEEDILKASLNNQFITESQYRIKQQELRKQQLRDEDEIKRKLFEQQKKSDLRNVQIETLESLASNVLNNYDTYDGITASITSAISYGIILAAGAAKADSIRRREYVGAKFEQGGIVEGPSHAQGGVPFTVQGQGGYEMEGGEFIVNKKAASLHRQLLESINNSVKPTATVQPMKFATGGVVNNTVVNNSAGESVHYLKAIAEATTSTAIQTSKPVRAFVSSKDLRTNDTERTLRERNDRI